jgi:undecaprenyl-diphosphatase
VVQRNNTEDLRIGPFDVVGRGQECSIPDAWHGGSVPFERMTRLRPVLRPALTRVHGALGAVGAELRTGERMLVLAAGVGLLLLTLDVAAGGLATYVDDRVLAHLGAATGRASPMSSVGEIGLASGILIVVVLVTTQATFRVWPLAVAAWNVGVGLLLVLGLKAAVGRVGPGESSVPDGYSGFYPSGHTATAGLCLGTAWFVLATWRGYGARWVPPRTSALFVGLAAATLAGVGAVIGGHHWMSDAAGGLLLTAMVLPVGFAACAVTFLGAAEAGPGPAR